MSVSTQIIQVLDELCRRFGIVIDWANESILPYIEELAKKFITYEIKTSWFWIIITTAVSVVVVLLGLLLWKIFEDDSAFVILLIIAVFVLTLVVGAQVYDIITCEVLPEKILLREIKELIQSSGNY